MTKLLDKIYFILKNISNPASFDEAYDDGFRAGVEVARARMLQEMDAKFPYELKNEAFRFGYKHAVEAAKGKL
jgi:hypothetical protein